MRFLGKRILKTGYQPAWYNVILYLGLAVIWFFLSEGIYSNRLNFLELRIMFFCQSGLIAIVYLSRDLLFQDVRSPRFFKWATGLFLLFFLGLKISPDILGMFGIQSMPSILGMPEFDSLGWRTIPWVFFEGIIFSIFLAWFAEIIFAVFRTWHRISRFDPGISYQFWNRLWMDIVKVGLLITLLMILVYFYIINFLLVDTIGYNYLLMVPIMGTGVCLFLFFFIKVSRWREAEILAIDRELAPYIEWPKYKADNDSDFKGLGWVQYLLCIREYLRQIKRPFISWWVVSLYLIFCGAVLSLPYLLKVTIEV
jgi:hypothetical protein